MPISGYYVSAYASSPSPAHWAPELEAQYFSALSTDKRIVGIEQPFYPDAQRYPLSWLREHIPAHWHMCITAVPLFMRLSQDNPHIGIASADVEGRHIAIKYIEAINHYVDELNQAFSRPIVKAIHIQTFPRQPAGHSTPAALMASLETIHQMPWQHTELNIEHCDAYRAGQAPEKGLMTLADEIQVISEMAGYGIVLNWARSAIEYRNATGPLKHLDMAISHKLLRGFFFSGCDDQISSAYGQWKDTHMPPQNSIHGNFLPIGGLLNQEAVHAAWQRLAAYPSSPYVGIKITNGNARHDVETSIGLTMESIAVLNTACNIN